MVLVCGVLQGTKHTVVAEVLCVGRSSSGQGCGCLSVFFGQEEMVVLLCVWPWLVIYMLTVGLRQPTFLRRQQWCGRAWHAPVVLCCGVSGVYRVGCRRAHSVGVSTPCSCACSCVQQLCTQTSTALLNGLLLCCITRMVCVGLFVCLSYYQIATPGLSPCALLVCVCFCVWVGCCCCTTMSRLSSLLAVGCSAPCTFLCHHTCTTTIPACLLSAAQPSAPSLYTLACFAKAACM